MGLFRNFSSSNLSSAAPLFEIRVENDIIVFRGSESEASSQILKGMVVLCLRESIKVQEIHLKLTGTCKVGWTEHKITATGMSTAKVGTAKNIYTHEFNPLLGQDTLKAGNYEWPFKLILPGKLPESVLGLPDSFITYTLKAVVERGILAHNLQAKKLVRIIRTFDPAALELSHTMTVENIWPNKIEYSIVIPQKAVIFGTAIQVKMQFTSLLKGLKIGKIRCCLQETQEYHIQSTVGATRGLEKFHKTTRDIDNWTFQLAEDAYQDMLNDSGSDGYVLQESMPLPKQLSKCMQDVDAQGLKIRHKVKFNIALHNPDGHISELRATLPVTIFISPNMPIDEDGCLIDQAPNSAQAVDIGAGAPPLYGQHVLDQIYGGIDHSVYTTPGPGTGMNTPFYSQSQSGSFENLSSLDGIANGAVPPSALTARLQNLNANGPTRTNSFMRRQHHSNTGSSGNTPHPIMEAETNGQRTDYFDLQNYSQPASHSIGHSAPNSNPISRRGSFEMHHEPSSSSTVPTSSLHPPTPGTNGIPHSTSGNHTPEHVDHAVGDIESLSRVPSYTTALKAPVRGLTYNENWNLPDYQTAMSRPSSPVRGASTGARTPEFIGSPPGQSPVHGPSLQNGARPRGPPRSHSHGSSLHRPHSMLGLTALTNMVHGHGWTASAHHSHRSTGGTSTPVDDTTRRLEALRMRS